MKLSAEQQKAYDAITKELKTMKDGIDSNERCLRLLEAGLKEYPLERDFVQLQKYKQKENIRFYEGKLKAFRTVEEIAKAISRDAEVDTVADLVAELPEDMQASMAKAMYEKRKNKMAGAP